MIAENLSDIKQGLPSGVKLVAVSKFHLASAISEAYQAGQRVFGESRPQEFAEKVKSLPGDIEWHFIGHLQTNKLKLVLPYASLVQSMDSVRLLEAVEKWCAANDKRINCLLELHLGAEETKQGLSEEEIRDILSHKDKYPHIVFRGLMGMATNTDDEDIIRKDFAYISNLMTELESVSGDDFNELSIGMSGDYKIAIEYGATMVRLGTIIFGERNY